MSRLYTCIISSSEKSALIGVAKRFSHAIEVLDHGVLFDVSGLERLIGKPDRVEKKILAEMRAANVSGSVAVAETVETAVLLARQSGEQTESCALNTPDKFPQLPLTDLAIEQDTLNVFDELGLRTVGDLLAVPPDELVGRYGQQFSDVIDVLEQKGRSFITPNVKENRVSWSFELDNPVEDFEQLIFLLNHGLERLFAEVAHAGFSTEYLDLKFRLRNKTEKAYEIKTSFPTLERSFWLKLINLRAALDPPEASITSVDVTAHFTKARPAQRGLYAVSRPEPESLLLTVNKLRKLVGEENIGVPVLLDQRAAEPFALDSARMPSSAPADPLLSQDGRGRPCSAIIAFNFFRPPIRAEVLVRDGRLVFIKSRQFAAHIINYSGVWKGNSRWWDRPWRTQEWDIEVEDHGVYRLCKAKDEWFLIGEYD
jgi:protein ImuB